jgi:hypothetical protein
MLDSKYTKLYRRCYSIFMTRIQHSNILHCTISVTILQDFEELEELDKLTVFDSTYSASKLVQSENPV